MRGQNTVTAMRMHKLKPAMVWLLALDDKCPRTPFMDAEQVVANGGRPEVHVGNDEIVGTLDFRFLTGLTVLLQGTDIDRLRAIFSRLREFDVDRIVTSTPSMIHDYRRAA